MHIFPYSRRPGTPADKMPGQLGNATKEDRSRRAIAVAEEMNRRYREALVGQTLEVLFEEADGEFYTGHAPSYMLVAVTGGEELHNCVKHVTITHTDGETLYGVIEEECV